MRLVVIFFEAQTKIKVFGDKLHRIKTRLTSPSIYVTSQIRSPAASVFPQGNVKLVILIKFYQG